MPNVEPDTTLWLLGKAIMAFSPFVAIFLIIAAILWFILPFVVFSIKDRLKQIEQQSRKTNALLEEMLKLQREQQKN